MSGDDWGGSAPQFAVVHAARLDGSLEMSASALLHRDNAVALKLDPHSVSFGSWEDHRKMNARATTGRGMRVHQIDQVFTGNRHVRPSAEIWLDPAVGVQLELQSRAGACYGFKIRIQRHFEILSSLRREILSKRGRGRLSASYKKGASQQLRRGTVRIEVRQNPVEARPGQSNLIFERVPVQLGMTVLEELKVSAHDERVHESFMHSGKSSHGKIGPGVPNLQAKVQWASGFRCDGCRLNLQVVGHRIGHGFHKFSSAAGTGARKIGPYLGILGTHEYNHRARHHGRRRLRQQQANGQDCCGGNTNSLHSALIALRPNRCQGRS